MRSIRASLWVFCLFVWASVAQAASLPDFKSLVKEASPAVVNISAVQKSTETERALNPFNGPGYEDMPEIFRHFFQMPDIKPRERRRSPQSLGSGFILSRDGYVLTNHHVIDGADEVIVRLSDRRELVAQVIGSDKRTDIALLKLDARNLPTVELGSSADLEVGEWVLAIGSPFGFDHSVTAGIVSAKERALANETYVPFIQTDVAINPGNSGGPLFNLEGEVVGINSQIYTRSGGFMGLSFAIPIDVAMEVAEQLKEQGFVSRGWLGVIIQEVNKDLAESFGLERPAGALVAKVLPESPAESGGLQEGDVITRFNGREVVLSSDLPHMVGRVKPGAMANLDVVRAGERKRLQLEIGELPEEQPKLASGQQQHRDQPHGNRLDVVVAELDGERKAKWNVRSGVVVQRVQKGAGASAGLMVGDVITMLNGAQVDSVERFNELVAELPSGRAVPMRIVRRGSPLFVPLKLND
ncbi:DegQ family serine endoprotease [Marinobacterium arenosum]|uniref:DegQ family serine endoprotease n=1 Tax=Marinobacterium arenosum TaxID=2862496 RepID=UPI001C985306|nr:DegQ family serine endoprotease [Marinobacterium arenosum]MBY4676783.1 DegQ family serine endoprotease [Marinobacterium arenosum]